MNDYLIHSGRKGMKWYQHIFKSEDKDTGEVKFDPVKSKNNIDAATKFVSDSKKLEEARSTKKKKKIEKQIEVQRRESMRFMNDEDLKKAVTRLNLEKQYMQLSTSDIELGKTKVKKILDASGAVLTVAGTAITLLSAMESYNKAKAKPTS